MDAIIRVCSESLMFTISMLANRPCEDMTGVIFSNTNHPLHSYLSPCICSDRKRRQYIRIHELKQRYSSTIIPYLVIILFDE